MLGTLSSDMGYGVMNLYSQYIPYAHAFHNYIILDSFPWSPLMSTHSIAVLYPYILEDRLFLDLVLVIHLVYWPHLPDLLSLIPNLSFILLVIINWPNSFYSMVHGYNYLQISDLFQEDL